MIHLSATNPDFSTSLNQNYSWPVIHLVVSARVSHISLRPQKKYNQESGRKRTNEQYGLGSAFCAFCRLSLACIFRETSTKATRNSIDCVSALPPSADHPSPGLRCPLPLSFFVNSLLSSLGPSFPPPLPVSREISSSSPLFGFHAKTKRSSAWHTTHIVSHNNLWLSLLGIRLRWGFLIWELIFYLLRTFCPHLGSFLFCCFFSLRFSHISTLTFFRWLTVTSDRNAESCNHVPSNYCLP